MEEHTYENCHNITCRRKCQKDGYNMAIDEFVKAIEEYYFKVEDSSFMPYLKNVRVVSEANIRHIAEQLKEECK